VSWDVGFAKVTTELESEEVITDDGELIDAVT